MLAFRSNEKPVLVFSVSDMTSDRAARFVVRAVTALDRGAKVKIDLASRRVDIEPSVAQAPDMGRAIAAAGYTPVLVVSSAVFAFGWVDTRGADSARRPAASAAPAA